MEKAVAMYIRISLEDEDMPDGKAESSSVTNQRDLLNRYLSGKEEFTGVAVKEFFDDGYTGRNFERPGFKEMIEQCRIGNIGCIVVKDLSRLGRNYVEVGNLLEQLFPFLGIRVISVNDGYDSNSFIGQTGGIDVAFKNLIYSLYSRDLSHKVKSAVETRMKRGEFMSPFGIFGYKKSEKDIHKLEIDREAADIVRRIFLMVAEGKPRIDIVKLLNEDNIPTAAVYKQRKGCTRDWYPDGKKGGWTTSMVARIIRDERYAGHMVSHRKEYDDFESKHQVDVEKSEWIVVRNTHEGIVTQEEFDQANANMRDVVQGKKKNAANKGNYSVIVCPYCGLTLRQGNKHDSYMHCPTGRMYRDSPCSQVRIRRKTAEETLVSLVRQQAQMLVDAELILKEKGRYAEGKPGINIEAVWAEIRKLEEKKIADYEKYREGGISKEVFLEQKKALDLQKDELTQTAQELEAVALTKDAGRRENQEAFQIGKYVNMESYDKKVMASLISSAKVIGEDCMEVTWKYQDVYEKILMNIGT